MATKSYQTTKRNFRCPDDEWEELEKTVEYFGFESKSDVILHLIRKLNRKRKEEEEQGREQDKFDRLLDDIGK